MKSLRVKLADFGVSTLLAGQEGSTEQKQSPGHTGTPVPGPRSPTRMLPPEEELAEEAAWEGETITPHSSPVVGAATAAEVEELTDANPEDGHQLTQTGILVGTPMFMAPELSEGSHHARPPSDVFSLGMIAYELFSGEIPFARPPVWARWRGKDAAAPPLSTKRPDLPREVATLIDSCLQLDPALRPTADTIATTLRGYVDPAFAI